MYKIVFTALSAVSFLSCVQLRQQGVNKFFDPIHLRIADFQDKRLSDSLYLYFDHSAAEYRKAAVLAFASVRDTLAINALNKVMVHDSHADVRRAAAFALGQLGNTRAATLIQQQLANEKDSIVRIDMIEAYGKTTSAWKLDITEQPAEGIARSVYRSVIRHKIDSSYYDAAFSFLTNKNSADTRLYGAHFFARLPRVSRIIEQKLIQAEAACTDSESCMALALALRKCKSDSALANLEKTILTSTDGRVRTNAIRSLQGYPFQKTKSILITALKDADINAGIAASEVINEVISAKDWIEIATLARHTNNYRIQANLYQAALSVSSNEDLATEITDKINNTTNPYQKSALITSLHPYVPAAALIFKNVLSNTPVVRTSAASALVGMNYLNKNNNDLISVFARYYEEAIRAGDAAVIGIIAAALADSTLGYKAIITDFNFLKEARKKLSLPKDNESIVPLEQALAYFEGRKPAAIKNEFNHPIDWQLIKTISYNQRVVVKTSKGDFIMQLLVEEAPGSVANFVNLVQHQYFNKKYFHRVVPNFVVQAGCNRGDGWGSEDYSIRSEFTHRQYKTGSVGMASAGRDTEGTQWFITHSPTPHLDGRYTIFAEVVAGMDVVNKIEVGDQILEVRLL